MIKTLIFDFDGLILDTETPVYLSWVEIYQRFGLTLPFDDWTSIIGTSAAEHFDPFDRLEAQSNLKLDRKELVAERMAFELSLVIKNPVLPGVKELIDAAQKDNLKLAVASSSTRDWVEGHLKRLKLIQHFDVICCSEDVSRTKPDPALFLLALEHLKLNSKEAIVLEDSPNGITAANRANIFSVAIPNGMTRDLTFSHADLRLGSLAESSLETLIQLAEK
ncbi:MAG: HAD family hydrolase [Chloroflexi bacterium]|nr:HAD family hydrolase [Chloroflexota bacterium]